MLTGVMAVMADLEALVRLTRDLVEDMAVWVVVIRGMEHMDPMIRV